MKTQSHCVQLLLLNLSIYLSFSIAADTINFRFSPSTNITLLGDAYLRNGAISLTRELGLSSPSPSSSSSSAIFSSSGRALYSKQIRFFDPNTSAAASFSSRFSFSITRYPSTPFGDGLAFLITSDSRTSGSSNGFLGIIDASNSTTQEPEPEAARMTIAVEFDTNLDLSLGDINDNHVALDINTLFSYTAVDAASMGIDLKSGKPMTAWIEYKNIDKTFRIWVSYSRFKPPNPLLATTIDLSRRFNEFMYVGFSASNGQGMGLHLIDAWAFKTFAFVPSKAGDSQAGCRGVSVSVSGSLGCPESSDYEFEDENGNGGDHSSPRRRKRKLILVLVGSTIAILFSWIGIATVGWWFLVKKKWEKPPDTCREEMKRIPARLSLAEIKSATRGFHCSRILGEGGSGTVYEGILSSGTAIAVKRFGRVDRFTDGFAREFTAVMGCLRQRNLVQLQGWCCEKDELLLVYEYMPNGTLDKLIHGDPTRNSEGGYVNSSAIVLSLDRRLKIVLGVASALAYLHEECEKQIIHRDVKACNIMLDEEFNAKLGDFGLAELNEHDGMPVQTLPAGTMGYLAPEYIHSGELTVKTDVYSFGVVALEVGTGKRPTDREFVLVDWVWGLWGKGTLVEAADPKLQGGFERAEMEKLLTVGLCCAHPDCEKRPTMKVAIRILQGEVPLPNLPQQKPRLRLVSLPPSLSGDSNGTPLGTSSINMDPSESEIRKVLDPSSCS